MFSGFLLILAFPKFNLEILAWVALIPLLWAIRKKAPPRAAFLGFVTGLVFFTGLLYWIYNVLKEYGHLPGWISIFLLILLTAYLALYFSLFAFLLRWVAGKTNLPETLFAPPLFVSLEYLRGLIFTGFPWELLGYSQFLTLPLVQISDITGVYGVSFIIVLANASLYRLAITLPHRGWIPALKEVLASGIIIALCGAYGVWKLSALETKARMETTFRVALIQGNIRQDVKWEPRYQEETLKIYSDLTLRVKDQRPDLIVWPETATPFFFQSAYPFQTRILELAHQVNAPLLFGAPAFERQGRKADYFNSAFLISPEKKILGRYDKIHLVPFGEYAPLSGFLGFTRDIIGAIGDFTPGKGVVNLSLPWGNFGVLICYEAIFPDLTRQFVEQGAQFLVNITNDAWFGRTSAPYQHLSMVTLRAVENRVSIVRAANTGVSALIDTSGRIVQSTDLFTRETLSGKIHLNKSPTFYTKWGDVFSYLCLGVTFLLLISLFFRRG
ncbi:MAG: apolipoprotein N-acyltransferase [Thermodesulfobacteriota bacterium]|nr:apolipoprotein N-acyltransferase [Thermodesulfobacteriota bacterium]